MGVSIGGSVGGAGVYVGIDVFIGSGVKVGVGERMAVADGSGACGEALNGRRKELPPAPSGACGSRGC